MRQLNPSELPAVLTIDTPIIWYSRTAQTQCQCRLRIYKIAFDQAVVIVSELEDNPVPLITAEAFRLIDWVCSEFALNSAKTMWIEHYPLDYLKDDETDDEVLLIQSHTYSTRVSKQKIEALLGVQL